LDGQKILGISPPEISSRASGMSGKREESQNTLG
jgi:hypothetical protein